MATLVVHIHWRNRRVKVVFDYSTRAEQMRFLMMGGVLFLVSWLLLDLHWMSALLISGAAAGSTVMLNVVYRRWRASIRVDDSGMEARLGKKRVRIPWDQMTLVDVTSSGIPLREGVVQIRHALVADALGRRIAFADLSLLGAAKALAVAESGLPIVSIGEPEILLAMVARRTGNEHLLPPSLREPSQLEGQDAPTGPSEPSEVTDGSGRRVDVAGLGVLAVKLGGKLVKAAGGLLKTVKPGLAIASGAVLAVFLDWRFAVGIMLMLMFHEMGHVWAMKRSGLPVRGIYFIPFLGAAAVTDGVWRTRAQQSYIALNGPLWGLYMTVPVLGAALLWGDSWPLLAPMAAVFSLINLFNLLPINPLDGGRLLNAVGHSLHSWVGASISVGAFVAAFLLAWSLDMGLLVVVGVFGLLEFINELQAWSTMRKMRAAGLAGSMGPEAMLSLRLLTRPSFGPRDEKRLRSMETRRFSRVTALSRVAPMPLHQTVLWSLFYLVLVGAFVGIIFLMSDDPAAALTLEVLR